MATASLSFSIILTKATDGEQLMKLLELFIPDILFLDINMPCKQGATCLKEIRANHRYDNVPIVMYTIDFTVDSMKYGIVCQRMLYYF